MKQIPHKLTYAQNLSQYEAHPSYYERILCNVLTVLLIELSLVSASTAIDKTDYTDLCIFSRVLFPKFFAKIGQCK